MKVAQCLSAGLLAAMTAGAAERILDFTTTPVGKTPSGFISLVTGSGGPGEWKIVMDDVPSALAPLTAAAAQTSKRAVLAQVSSDRTDERFPLLVLDDEIYRDFKFSIRFKTVEGKAEQMAGVAFRIQNPTNYYVIRASSLGNNLRFYKFVDGVRSPPIGPVLPVPTGQWHALEIECRGNQIRCWLNQKEVIPTLTDSSFQQGKLGFWTKSDAVSYFADAKIDYVPIESTAQVVVRQLMGKFPRMLGVRIAGKRPGASRVDVVASTEPSEVGTEASAIEKEVIATDGIGYLKSKQRVVITLPLRDRNGEALAAMQVILDPFLGQTRDNAIARATPIVQEAQKRIRASRELAE